MKIKKLLTISYYLFFIFTTNMLIAAVEKDIGLTQEIYVKLCGVWDTNKNKILNEKQFSWGKSKWAMYRSFVIDLGEDQPFFIAQDVMGKSVITKVYKEKDKYILRVLFHDNNEYDLEISIPDNNIIIFHKMDWFKKIPLVDHYGEENKYYKISGPTIKYMKPKVNDLRLRTEPSLKGEKIRNLNRDDKLLILKKGKEETIEGEKGNWVKVLTSNNELGWCFDNYLDSIVDK